MKNKGLIIILIILLFIIIIGLIGFLVLGINGRLILPNGVMNLGTRTGEIVLDENFDLETIKEIEILSEAGDITFEKSTDSSIRVIAYGKNESDVKVNLYENKLKVDYIGQARSWMNFGFYKNDIIVYIPENYSENLNIKNEYGNCKISDLENASISIDSDCGNIELGKVRDIIVDCDYGNVKIDTILNKCKIKSDCGNIEIKKIQIQENSEIKSDYGNIEIKEINDIYVDADVDLGEAKINGNNRQSDITLKINADCGNVNIGG